MRRVSPMLWWSVVLASASMATLLRLLAHPMLEGQAVFLLGILAVAISSHLAGTSAGFATLALTFPPAIALFLPREAGHLSSGAWLNLAFALGLTVPLCVLGGRSHRLMRELDQALARERAARGDAERANRVRDDFLAILSHELRSPLNAIVGWTHILKSVQGQADHSRAVETILRNADHQLRLIGDITDLSRGLSGKLILEEQLVDVRGPLEEAVDAVRLSADARHISLQLVLPETPLIVRGEASRLRQVFWNLLSNAIKFSPSGASVQAAAAAEGESIVVSVVDKGQGITAEFLPYVFDNFRQEDATKARRHGGLGLGLAIVRHLVEAHGGSVKVASRGLGTGATFAVTLPVCVGVAADSIEQPDLNRPQLAGVRLLVVDDDPDTRELLVRSLGELGASVCGAASAAEARLQLSKEWPHAIVSDIGMPIEDGIAFMRSLKKQPQYKRIPAIALTAYSSKADREEALQAGYSEHVPKPVHPYRLARTIVAALRRPN